MGYDIAVYTKETNNQIGPSGALAYVSGLANQINTLYNNKFMNDIVLNL